MNNELFVYHSQEDVLNAAAGFIEERMKREQAFTSASEAQQFARLKIAHKENEVFAVLFKVKNVTINSGHISGNWDKILFKAALPNLIASHPEEDKFLKSALKAWSVKTTRQSKGKNTKSVELSINDYSLLVKLSKARGVPKKELMHLLLEQKEQKNRLECKF